MYVYARTDVIMYVYGCLCTIDNHTYIDLVREPFVRSHQSLTTLRMGRRGVARVSIRRSPAHTTNMCTYVYMYVYMYMYMYK